MDTTRILDGILDSVVEAFSPEAARKLADLQPGPAFQRRMDELAQKSSGGGLSPEEHDEFRNYVQLVEMISLLQAKVRRKFGIPTT